MAIDYVRGVFSRHTPEANRVNSLKLCPLAILIPLEENPYAVPHLKALNTIPHTMR